MKITIEVSKNSHRYITLMNLLRSDDYIFSTEAENQALQQHSVMQGLLSDCCQAKITTTEIHYCEECDCSCSPTVGQRSGDTGVSDEELTDLLRKIEHGEISSVKVFFELRARGLRAGNP